MGTGSVWWTTVSLTLPPQSCVCPYSKSTGRRVTSAPGQGPGDMPKT